MTTNAAKSMRDLPAKTLNGKTSKSVKGGDSGPTETITFNYGHVTYKY